MLNRGFLWHNPIIHIMDRDDMFCCISSLDNHCSLGCKCKKILFLLYLDSLSFLLGCLVLGMEFWVKPPTIVLLMSSQFVILEIVLSWVTWHSIVPTIDILMTPFTIIETNQIYYDIPSWFMIILSILVNWSPKSWSGYGWWNHLFSSLFQAYTSRSMCLSATSFSNYLFLHGNGLFSSSSCLDEGGLSWNCSIISNFPHESRTNASSVLLKVAKGIGRWVYRVFLYYGTNFDSGNRRGLLGILDNYLYPLQGLFLHYQILV